jgi:hypothetical protein
MGFLFTAEGRDRAFFSAEALFLFFPDTTPTAPDHCDKGATGQRADDDAPDARRGQIRQEPEISGANSLSLS